MFIFCNLWSFIDVYFSHPEFQDLFQAFPNVNVVSQIYYLFVVVKQIVSYLKKLACSDWRLYSLKYRLSTRYIKHNINTVFEYTISFLFLGKGRGLKYNLHCIFVKLIAKGLYFASILETPPIFERFWPLKKLIEEEEVKFAEYPKHYFQHQNGRFGLGQEANGEVQGKIVPVHR